MALAVTETELQDLLESSPFNRPYGFRVQSIGEGVCTVAVPFKFTYERPDGLISGPVFMAAADVTMWLAIMTQTGIIDRLVTVEMKTNFLNAARAEDVICTGERPQTRSAADLRHGSMHERRGQTAHTPHRHLHSRGRMIVLCRCETLGCFV